MRRLIPTLPLLVASLALVAGGLGLFALRSRHPGTPPTVTLRVVSSLWSIPVAGGRPHLLLRERAQDAFPVYRRGGRSILFVRPTSLSTTALFSFAADGHPRRLRSLPLFTQLAYSPASDELVVVRGHDVVAETLSGRRVGVLARMSPLGWSAPSVSADGGTVGFSEIVRTPTVRYQHQLVVVRDGRKRTFRTTGVPDLFAVSPHGERLAFGLAGRLLLLDVATGQRRLVTAGGSQAAWSPDGRTIAYNDARGLLTLDLVTGRRRFIAARATGQSFAPDGGTLLYVTLKAE